MNQKLRILIVDDDYPSGCVESVLTRLIQSLRNNNYVYDLAGTFAEAESFLQAPTKNYDLILLDLRLDGEYAWGGSMLLDKYWQRIQMSGSKVLLYSGKSDAVSAYEWFGSGSGPFLFYQKAGKIDVGEDFKAKIITLLRDRSRSLCRRASLNSALVAIRNESASVSIEGRIWSVASLIAPWLYRLPNENECSAEAIRRSLFPSDDLIRVLSYWFKARSFVWPPSNAMYGLQPLALYHLSGPTGPLDALMHDPWANDVEPCFGEAANTAFFDNEILKDRLGARFNQELQNYIGIAKSWTRIHGLREIEDKIKALKKKVEFKLPQLIESFESRLFEDKTVEIDSTRVDGIPGFEFYCPPRYSKDVEAEPVVIFAMRALAKSLSERANKALSLTFDYDGDLYSKGGESVDLPYLLVALCHDGEPCAPNESINSWFQEGHKGHDLFEAKRSLVGCAQWHVLSGGNSQLQSYESPMDPGTLSLGEATTLWERFNSQGKWNIVHVLKFGFPSIEDCNA